VDLRELDDHVSVTPKVDLRELDDHVSVTPKSGSQRALRLVAVAERIDPSDVRARGVRC